jgi:oxalate decarboxylase/phosphoglucose isomerase-like protein (cupin superfamily)
MKEITLRVDGDTIYHLDSDQIVIDELKDAYQMNNKKDVYQMNNKFGPEPEYELLEAIQTVLKYYMIHYEYEEWVKDNPICNNEE